MYYIKIKTSVLIKQIIKKRSNRPHPGSKRKFAKNAKKNDQKKVMEIRKNVMIVNDSFGNS